MRHDRRVRTDVEKPGCTRASQNNQISITCDMNATRTTAVSANSFLTHGAAEIARARDARRLATNSLRAIVELDNRQAEERRELILNLFDLDGSDDHERALQRYALKLRGRFAAAEWIDCICCLFGWRFLGLGPVDLGLGDLVVRGAAFEWLRQGDDDHVVRVELGDEPELMVSADSGNTWRVIDVSELSDVLGDWVELQARGASMRGAA